MNVIQKIVLPHATRDELLNEHKRQMHIKKFHQRYVSCLRDMRSELGRSYERTKGRCPMHRYRDLRQLVRTTLVSYQDILTTKRNELQILDRGDFDLLESYDCGLDEVGKGSARIESCSFLNVGQQFDKRLQMMREDDSRNAMATAELQKSTQSLQIGNVKLQEQFREECSVFQQLATQYNTCEKYCIFQRYVALKCVIKIAAKSDV